MDTATTPETKLAFQDHRHRMDISESVNFSWAYKCDIRGQGSLEISLFPWPSFSHQAVYKEIAIKSAGKHIDLSRDWWVLLIEVAMMLNADLISSLWAKSR